MRFRITGIGLMTASMFGGGVWYALGEQPSAIISGVIFFASIAFSLSQVTPGPGITVKGAFAALILTLGLSFVIGWFPGLLFFFACMATATSFVFR